MRKIREILRWKLEQGRSHREIAKALGVSLGRITSVLARANELGIGYEELSKLSEAEIEERFYGSGSDSQVVEGRPPLDYKQIHAEMKKKGVTLELLHEEYLTVNPGGYSYSRFCELYQKWRRRQRVTMRQLHRSGEKVFVDYAGARPKFICRNTGKEIKCELFVAVLGASNFTYIEVTATQQVPDFVQSHINAFEYFGGVPEVVVPDQLKSGVSQSCRYEPKIQRTYSEMASYYGTVVIPARPRKPKDKAKAEVGVLIAERWVLARLRRSIFFSRHDLGVRVAELREEMNDRIMRSYGKSRRQLYEEWDRPALKPLPASRYIVPDWRVARVSIDCHVEVDHHYYSAPFQLIGEMVDVRLGLTTVEIVFRGTRVASHVRSYNRGRHTTKPEHLPASHRAHSNWTPSRIVAWGKTIGEKTGELVELILTERPHPEQGYRSCLGILRLAKVYGKERLEAACARGVAIGVRSYRRLDTILKNGMDKIPLPDSKPTPQVRPVEHENIRGPEYYKEEG